MVSLALNRLLRRIRDVNRAFVVFWLAFLAFPLAGSALPRRLILGLDGIAYRDMKALQAGLTYTDPKGMQFHRQAFNHGYFPVSRMVSTFPSTSDVAWTQIFGDRPLPGYQRTYFSAAANRQVAINGVTTSMEHEMQMQCQLQNGFLRGMGYLYSFHIFELELHDAIRDFLHCNSDAENYYAYLRATDDSQHLNRDVFAILCTVDRKLEELRARYRAIEGRDLEILILSDHGNNHAGPGKRVQVVDFLEKAGYHVTKSLVAPKDVVLPTTGIESWVEIHNQPAETDHLVPLLSHLAGVDVITARDPSHPDQFLVMNSKDERARIEWIPATDSYRYLPEQGDPLNYRSAVDALTRAHELDAGGFATADAWMKETVGNRYPLALERIVWGLTRDVLNPATILISLDNRYVHAGWLVKAGSELVTFGGTHGALDDINSDGILLSNFAPTHDTSTRRVAGLYGNFPGLRQFRAEQDGAEWVTRYRESLAPVARTPLDRAYTMLPDDKIFLRVWSPRLTNLDLETPIDLTVWKVHRYVDARIRRSDPEPADPPALYFVVEHPISFPEPCSYDRVYALPSGLALEPGTAYWICGRLRSPKKSSPILKFIFRTDAQGRPVAY